MARVKKTTELIPMEKPSMMPEDYCDYGSALIQYGSIKWQKSNKMLSDGGEGSSESLPLSLEQVQYLNMRMAGISMADACKALKILPDTLILWEEESEKGSLFSYCAEAIKRKQALLLEDSMWETAMQDNSSRRDIMKMFLIKPRMPEYKENSPSAVVPVQVNISIDGQPYVADTKLAGEDEDE